MWNQATFLSKYQKLKHLKRLYMLYMDFIYIIYSKISIYSNVEEVCEGISFEVGGTRAS